MANFKSNILKTIRNKVVSWEKFLEFLVVFKNVRLKVLRQKLQKLESVLFDKIYTTSHFFSIFKKLKNNSRKIFSPQVSFNLVEKSADINF